jgi:hypothetical protein
VGICGFDSFEPNSGCRPHYLYYCTPSIFIYPLGDMAAFFDLMASELESYKRPDHAVLAFNEMTLKLAVIGGGEIGHEICRLVRRKYEQISKIFVLLSNRSKSPSGDFTPDCRVF